MAGEVRSEADVWRLRAAAAEDAARELDELGRALQRVLTRNYFGVDCVEGEVLFERLSAIVDGVGTTFAGLGNSAQLLAARCRSACDALEGADSASW